MSQLNPEVPEGATKLFSYVETYRQMIEKINKFDKIIEHKGSSSGKTLDMRGGGAKQKRNYRCSKKIDGDAPQGTGGFPKHI